MVPRSEREATHPWNAFLVVRVFDGRAPVGHHLLTTFIGGSRNTELCDRAAAELIELAISEIRSLLRVEGEPSFTAIKKWNKTIPQYNMPDDRYDVLAEITFACLKKKVYAIDHRALVLQHLLQGA